MVNTRIIYISIVTMMLGLSGCGEDNMIETNLPNEDMESVEVNPDFSVDDVQTYPQIVYIDDVTYYGTSDICDDVPRRSPDGVIETFVSPEIMPDSYNSANFGSEQGQLEYMFLEDNELIIHIGEEWYYFEQG